MIALLDETNRPKKMAFSCFAIFRAVPCSGFSGIERTLGSEIADSGAHLCNFIPLCQNKSACAKCVKLLKF